MAGVWPSDVPTGAHGSVQPVGYEYVFLQLRGDHYEPGDFPGDCCLVVYATDRCFVLAHSVKPVSYSDSELWAPGVEQRVLFNGHNPDVCRQMAGVVFKIRGEYWCYSAICYAVSLCLQQRCDRLVSLKTLRNKRTLEQTEEPPSKRSRFSEIPVTVPLGSLVDMFQDPSQFTQSSYA